MSIGGVTRGPRVILCNVDGTPLSSSTAPNGSVALNITDPNIPQELINTLVRRDTAVSSTLAVATVGDGSEYEITVADATGFLGGNVIDINTASTETTLPIIISIATNTLTLDRRVDKAHDIGDTVTVVETDMASLAGTLAAPVEYYIGPLPTEAWHITRFMFELQHGTAGDLGKFGGIPALINGVLIRIRENGGYKTLTNWKTNASMKTDMYDIEFDARSGGGGAYGTSGRWTFERSGSVVRLNGATNDQLEIYIQDDITALASFTLNVQGHME